MSEATMWIAEAAARAAVLAGVAAALALFRVRDAAARSAVWNAVTVAALLMPLAVLLMPPVFLCAAAPMPPLAFTDAPRVILTSLPPAPVAASVDWLAALYLAGLAVALAHLGVGLAGAALLRRRATPAGIPGVCESREIGVPVTTSWLRPAILLPTEWRRWEPRKLEAVLLHERAHIARGDFFFHTLAALHRAVYWFNPLAWWMQRNNAALAEQASDDLALAQVEDRALYAEVLFSFVNQPRLAPPAPVVAMARSGAHVGERIDRVLGETRALARPVRFSWLASIFVTTGVALYAASAISFAQAPPAPPRLRRLLAPRAAGRISPTGMRLSTSTRTASTTSATASAI
ncbi:MAG: M56 family metallopeptidase [Acidobacteria bacterium]|nr:M56 family metallopeptidase [Acidobacteriota bacterium]